MASLDYAIIVVYLVGIIAAGLLCRGKQDSAEDYFSGGGGMGGFFGTLAVGLSIAATFFSGISFVAIPSLVISDGSKVLLLFLPLIPCALIVSYWFIPRYLAFGGLHPYEIIATRLGSRVRTVTSGLYIFLRLGWMATLIYAPTIVLMTMLDLGSEWLWPIILIVGLTSTVYTSFSGLRGVVITDAIQMLIILGSLLLAAMFAFSQIPFEPANWAKQMVDQNKLTAPSLSFNFSDRFTLWGVLLGVLASNMAIYIGDQMSLQRYLATGNVEAAKRSFLYNMVGVFAVLAMLVAIGIVILLWRTYHPEIPLPENPDQVFPAFVSLVLPTGLSGLMVAAILAATMSSITSGINALAGAITIDFIQPARPDAPPAFFLRIGRWLSLGIGVIATIGAGFAAGLGTIFDVSQAILGVFLGPIFGVVVLSVWNRNYSQTRVIVSLAISCLCGLLVALSPMQSIWVTISGLSACLLVAGPGKPRDQNDARKRRNSPRRKTSMDDLQDVCFPPQINQFGKTVKVDVGTNQAGFR